MIEKSYSPLTARRVVITGMGAVTPLGLSVREIWPRMIEGHSGIGPITLFDASEFPTRIAGEVKGFDFNAWLERDSALQFAGRGTFFALKAAEEAFRDSHLRSFNINPDRFGIYFGAGDSGSEFIPFVEMVKSSFSNASSVNPDLVDKGLFVGHSTEKMHGRKELEMQPFMTVAHLARRFDIRGPVSNCLTACAASSQAIGEASEWIRRGDADIVMSGGAHSMVYPLGIAGFSSLTVLSSYNEDPAKASRPFDKRRDGFVLAEGAGVVLLEELQHALKRHARIYGEIIGYGSTTDAYRLTDMDPIGVGGARAIEMALKKAHLTADDINYINAHGTATSVNDAIETLVIKKVLGAKAYEIPVSSIKSMIGHMIAAAGVMEVITCLLAMKDKVIPPTINYEEPDPDCDLDYVPNLAREKEVKVALSNSFGFGGQNICLALSRYDE